MDTEKLKEALKAREMTLPSLAKRAKMKKTGLFWRMTGGNGGLRVSEANRIVRALGVNAEEAADIFFRDKSHFTRLSNKRRVGKGRRGG